MPINLVTALIIGFLLWAGFRAGYKTREAEFREAVTKRQTDEANLVLIAPIAYRWAQGEITQSEAGSLLESTVHMNSGASAAWAEMSADARRRLALSFSTLNSLDPPC